MFSTFVTYIGCGSGLNFFQMPRRTKSSNVVCQKEEANTFKAIDIGSTQAGFI